MKNRSISESFIIHTAARICRSPRRSACIPGRSQPARPMMDECLADCVRILRLPKRMLIAEFGDARDTQLSGRFVGHSR